MKDWTTGETGSSNSSTEYLEIVGHVQRLIMGSAHQLFNGNARGVAALIVSQLAHEHGMVPSDEKTLEKVYMVLDYIENKKETIRNAPAVIVEHLGACGGRILHEDGGEIGRHHSSSFDFLRSNLKRKLDNPDKYEIIDLIGKPVPEQFKAEGRDCE